jgi:hypothetical protein
MHFAANAIQNDIVEVQGNDGFLLAGQVRRPGTQSFDGYVGDGTMSKEETESYRRQFFSFFRKNFFYKVIYVFSDGTAIQRKSGFLVDDPTVEELYQMYPEYHVALNFEDVNYYSYSEDEEGQEQYAKEATIDTSSMRATGGLVWDNLGVVWEDTQWGGEQTASGTEMTIQNEMNVRSIVDDIRLDGDTFQQTYSGKNLFSLFHILSEKIASGSTITMNNGTSYTVTESSISTTASGNDCYLFVDGSTTLEASDFNIPVTGGTDYTLSYDCDGYGQYIIRVYSGGGTQLQQLSNNYLGETGHKTATFTTDASASYLRIRFDNESNRHSESVCTISNVQLEKSSSETAYEPYTGGIPAPNPDYPQDVQVVTGEQTIGITGKNLLDSSSYTDQYINSSGNAVPGGGTNALFGYVPVSPSTQYTLSASSSTRMSFAYYDASKTFITRDTGHDGNSYTITTPDNCQFVRIWVYKFGGIDQAVIGSYRLMFEKGSTVTDYTPFQGAQSYTIDLGSIELCKIGDYQDYIYKSGDDWYVHKEVVKISPNGTEEWKKTSSQPPTGQFYVYTTDFDSIVKTKWYSGLVGDNFTMWGGTPSWLTPTTIVNGAVFSNSDSSGAAALRIMFPSSIVSSVETAKTWFALNLPVFYYPIATPTDTKITDATLVGQLNALGAMRLFIGENNLIAQATGTNLPAPLSFKYYTTVAMTGAEWEEGGSGGATVVEVDSITNTYPIWRVKGPAVDPQLSVINTNTTIRYTGTVTSTQTLEIDMFNKTARLNGVSVIGNVSGDWVSLAPGTNRVIYTAENADAQPSTIEWQEVVG